MASDTYHPYPSQQLHRALRDHRRDHTYTYDLLARRHRVARTLLALESKASEGSDSARRSLRAMFLDLSELAATGLMQPVEWVGDHVESLVETRSRLRRAKTVGGSRPDPLGPGVVGYSPGHPLGNRVGVGGMRR